MNKLLKKQFDYYNQVLEKYCISYKLKQECFNILALKKEFNIRRLLDKKLKGIVEIGYKMQEVEKALSKLYKLQVINEKIFSSKYDIEIIKTYEIYYEDDIEDIAIIKRKNNKDKNFKYIYINLDTLEYKLNHEPNLKELELFK